MPSSVCVKVGAVLPPVLYSAVTAFEVVGSARRTTRSMRALLPEFAGTVRLFVLLLW